MWKAGIIKFGDPMHESGTLGPYFHYDFGDPSGVNLGTPIIEYNSIFIVEREESEVAMSLLGSAEL